MASGVGSKSAHLNSSTNSSDHPSMRIANRGMRAAAVPFAVGMLHVGQIVAAQMWRPTGISACLR